MAACLKIFCGPPGTGKTWSAAREAVRILSGSGVPEGKVEEEHRRLVAEGRIIWVTFHPSFTYEDFVEGFRPETGETGAIGYRVVAGPFLDACLACSQTISSADFKVGDLLPKVRGGSYRVTHVDLGGVLLESDDARVGRVNERTSYYVDFYTLRLFREAGATASDFALGGGSADNLARRQELARLTGYPTTWMVNASPHGAVYRALEHKRRAAAPAVRQDVVLIVDEINRADLSRVFGELITLLEFDKRAGAEQERKVRLTYSRREFTVPAGLSVIGTMNTVDRSLSSIDLALRRRFEFIEVRPDPDLVPASYGGLNVRRLFEEINLRLAYLRGRANLLDHADYMLPALEATRMRSGRTDSADGQLETLAAVLRTKTIPLLDDLFRSDWSLIRTVVGSGLFEQPDPPPGLDGDDPDSVIGEDAASAWKAADWWDPSEKAWSAKRFAEALGRYRSEASGT